MRCLELIISPTIRCNLRCKYCYVNKEQPRETSDLSLDDIRNLYIWIKEYSDILQIRHIKIQWFGGEPLLFGADFIAHCIDMQKEIFPVEEYTIINSMQTNLTLIDDSAIKFIKEYFHSQVSGSFDYGSDWRIFPDGTISGPVVEKVFKKLHENHIKIGIVCTLTRQNLPLIHEMYHYFKTNQINFRINRAGYYNNSSCRDEYVTIDEYNQAIIQLFDEYLSDPEPTIEFYNFTLMSEIYLSEHPFRCTNPENPELALGFEAQGRIMPRCRYRGAIGNYLTESPKLFLDRIRTEMTRPIKRPGKCQDCEYWGTLCSGSCLGEEDLDCMHAECGYRTEANYPLWKYIEKYLNEHGFTRGQFKNM